MRYRKNDEPLTFEQAKEKALRLLEFRAHSERELRDKLKRAGAEENDIEEILDFCRRYGFVNDTDYALSKARDLQKLKKYGLKRIRSELYSKGISSEDVENALSSLDDGEEETLLPLVEKKLAGNFDKKNTDKCIRYFLYRGYSFTDIKNCIENIKSEYEE